MRDLIEALTILLKYGDYYTPTHCEHDRLMIGRIDPDDVSEEDKNRLDELGFFVCDEDECFKSFRFGVVSR